MKTDAVTDFQQFAGLRAQAQKNDPEVLRRSAQQFEGLMIQQMLKSMRAASPGDDLMGGGQTEFYRDMFDQQLSTHLAAGKGLGIADLLVRQLRGRAASEPTAAATETGGMNLPARAAADIVASPSIETLAPQRTLSSFLMNQARLSRLSGGASDAASSSSSPLPGAAEMSPARGPRAFVEAIRPHAERAAAELGVPARILMAQAALETGWGRRAIRHDDGQSAFNFFGIKADNRWNGSEVQRVTREFEEGEAVSVTASFRAYESPGAAFDDYVRFLKTNPRYAEALQHGGDERRFVSGLQKAGYATDPAYADKILRVANGRTMQGALGSPRMLSV